MATTTLTERFAPLIAGRYTGQPVQLWRLLRSAWVAADVCADLTPDDALTDAVMDATEKQNEGTMMVLCDWAEEVGVSGELCDLTRQALRVQYQTV